MSSIAIDQLIAIRMQLRMRKAIEPALFGAPIEAAIDDVFEIVRERLPFDLATFVQYLASEESTDTNPRSMLIRGRYAIDGKVRFRWPTRWLEAPSELTVWLEGCDTLIADLDAFYRDNPELEELRSNEIIQTYERRGATSFLLVPYRVDGRIVGSLTLARCGGPSFTDVDQEWPDAMDLSDIVRCIDVAYHTKSAAFHQEVRDLFAPTADAEDVANEIVRRLVHEFEWDYVGLYRVARARARFELVAQHSSSRSLLMKDGYCQNLDVGMMGTILRDRRPLRISSIRTGSANPHNYISLSAARSCLQYPIKLDGEVEWILDCEALEVSAFQLPDETALAELVRSAEETIALWFEMRLNQLLVEHVDQAIVVVDEENLIQRCNSAAETMLQFAPHSQARPCEGQYEALLRSTPLKGRLLEDFGYDEEARAVLSANQVATKTIQLATRDGRARSVLASSREIEGAFSRRVWRLNEQFENEWVEALKYLRTTVQGVAQQTRGPLMLAQALMGRARNLIEDRDGLDGIIDRALQSLSKADITYERLATNLDAVRDPIREGHVVALDLPSALNRLKDALGPDEADTVTLRLPEQLPALRADAERFMFALRSIVGYMLSIRYDDARLDVRARAGKQNLSLQFRLPRNGFRQEEASDTCLSDPATAEARAISQFAPDAVRAVIEGHGGSFRQNTTTDGLIYVVTLPIDRSSFDAGG